MVTTTGQKHPGLGGFVVLDDLRPGKSPIRPS